VSDSYCKLKVGRACTFSSYKHYRYYTEYWVLSTNFLLGKGTGRGSPPGSTTYDTIRYDTRCYFNVRSKADISQLNLPHGTDN